MSTNNKISNLITSQVPFFVRNDHPTFIRFLELYYEYLEQSGKALDQLKNFQSFTDIDRTIDPYVQKFYDNYIRLLPRDVIVDKHLILKYIKDFYRARGTEKSIQFLLRLLFNQESSLYFPKTDILIASDGKWFIEKSLKIGDIRVNGTPNNDLNMIRNFISKRVIGNTSNALATVETIDFYYEGGVLISEMKLSNQVDDFDPDEIIYTTFEEENQEKTLTANVLSGIIVTATVTREGTKYKLGEEVVIESNTGSGGRIVVSSVTIGNVKTITVLDGGTGFRPDDIILISGGGGSGAAGNVLTVNTDEKVHPNSYNIFISLINQEANTPIGNATYSNLISSVSDPANNWIQNSLNYFVFANTGPILKAGVVGGGGNNYVTPPTAVAVANTRIKELGILGKLGIVDGGSNYVVGDTIEFINIPGIENQYIGWGTGAAANVTNVDANGTITEIKFVPVPGHITGGAGYSQDNLPVANVISGTGNGANIIVMSVLGQGEDLTTTTDTIGVLKGLRVVTGGSGYKSAPTLNLQSIGDGTAQAFATVVTGVFSYPGRYLNDDGHLSSFNFLQDGRYYHNYSYVVRIKQSLNDYKKAILDLLHPAGMKLFGEYLFVNEDEPKIALGASAETSTIKTKFVYSTYVARGFANGSNVSIVSNSHGQSINSNVYLEFVSGNTINITNGRFMIVAANSNTFFVLHPNTTNTSGNVYAGFSI